MRATSAQAFGCRMQTVLETAGRQKLVKRLPHFFNHVSFTFLKWLMRLSIFRISFG